MDQRERKGTSGILDDDLDGAVRSADDTGMVGEQQDIAKSESQFEDDDSDDAVDDDDDDDDNDDE